MPALNFSGWYDVFMNGAIENFVGMRAKGGNEVARKGQKLVVGPWIHLPWVQKVGEVDFGPEAVNPVDELQLNWFDHWLKGKSNAVATDPPVRVFVMGANKWRAAQDWPIPGTQFTEYDLHSGGAANTRYGNGWLSTEKPTPDEAPDRYRYDPANPVPSKGGHSCCTSDTAPVGPFDQAPIQERADVLVYTTPPLEKPAPLPRRSASGAWSPRSSSCSPAAELRQACWRAARAPRPKRRLRPKHRRRPRHLRTPVR